MVHSTWVKLNMGQTTSSRR